MFTDLLLILTALYVLEFLAMAYGAARSSYPRNPSYQPKVSVIIAARNEEANIGKCLQSIAGQHYQADLLEVIVVNDRSTDATARIIQEYADRLPNIWLHNASPSGTNHQGKTNALIQGIKASNGEILMITDADCVVPPSWVETTVQHYADETVGVVPGVTLLQHANAFEGMQSFDWIMLFAAAAGTVRLGFPVTAMGNNFSIRRSVYNSVGGYENLPFSVTEDYVLFHAVAEKREYSIRLPVDPRSTVVSNPCVTWKQLFRQKQRWFLGGREMNAKYIAGYVVPFLLHAMLVVSLVVDPVLGALCFAAKAFADALLALPLVSRLRQWDLYKYFPLHECYYVLYTPVFPLIVMLRGNTEWKGQVLANVPLPNKQQAP